MVDVWEKYHNILNFYFKTLKKKSKLNVKQAEAGIAAQVLEHLPHKHMALISNSSSDTPKNMKVWKLMKEKKEKKNEIQNCYYEIINGIDKTFD